MQNILDVAKKINLTADDLVLFGTKMAKLSPTIVQQSNSPHMPDGKLILVTAMSPTPLGEGKTTTTIGLGQGLAQLQKKVMVVLREPSLGPCFGMKGGATGGGLSRVEPSKTINLHFTGDFHAITAAHNLIAALIDNHVYFGNSLRFRHITWKRVLDLNDRALRNIVVGLGETGGIPREDGFMITAASELMAILCLASDLADLKTRLARLVIGIDTEGNHITLAALEAVGAIMVLLRNAFWPNLVQTTEGVPTLIHGGPFANIAHGCNSVVATKTALKLADYVITEAGFGADLGAEKFCHIKCRQAKLQPDAVVLVVTCRALKYNGGGIKKNLEEVDMATLEVGMCNMVRHLENLAKFNLNPLVALNRFAFDAPEEITMVENYCRKLNVSFSVCEAYNKGGVGAMDLAKKISEALDINNNKSLKFLYDMKLPLKNKVEILAKDIYRAKKVIFTPKAIGKLKQYTEAGFGQFPVCIAKTQYSFSDDSTLLGAPENFTFTVEDANLAAGAGFVVCLAGNIMTMPGLPKLPNALHMDLTDDGDIEGLLQ